ncbi:MAG: hypothetical protein RLZZ136_1856 [Pseudomonadota bacterium]
MRLKTVTFLLTATFLATGMATTGQAKVASKGPSSSLSAVQTEDSRLSAIFAQDAEREQILNPLEAIFRGERADPAMIARLFTPELDRRQAVSVQKSLAALARINRGKLSPERQISYDVFSGDKRQELGFLQPDMLALTAVRPMNHFGGLHVEFPSIIAAGGTLPYTNQADYDASLAIIRTIPKVLDNAILRFREGQASGVVESKLTVTNMIGQIDALLAQPLDDSPFISPVKAFPDAVPASARPQITAAYRAAVGDAVYPAYRRLRAYLHDEYLPVAREQVGLSAMKGGSGLYRELVKAHTTLDLAPDTIHELGLLEVARIQMHMESVKKQLGFTGTLTEFFDTVRSDPRFHPKAADDLSNGFARIAASVDALIPQYFAQVPKTKLQIEPYPAYREKYEAGGSYNQGSSDGARPGVFFYNAYDLPSRYVSGMATLYLHEGIPGHHFQISLAQENESLPDFQRFGGNTAFVEGWALYAETLGYPMGLYEDPLQHWGTLDDEMLRAMRLVVDTGLHTKGWSRDQAIAYMLANSGMGRTDATAEVERYIAIPGQALSYKLGALTIQRLRKQAEQALGPKFDIRAFHEQVLGSGALPLPVLEAKINRWIAQSR